MNKALESKLKTLPRSPGVYFHKSHSGEIIYVGKAAVLKHRVRQYFQASRGFDNKTIALVNEIYDTDWVETESEIDALFLESEMVKRYMPRYNVLLRDDKSQSFVRITMKDEWPVVTLTRNPADDGAEYFGPFYNSLALKKALRYLRRVFPYFVREPKMTDSKLEMQIGLNPNISQGNSVYKANLRRLISYIKGHRKALVRELEQSMKQAAVERRFEEAAALRNKIRHLGELQRRIMFGDKEFLDITKDHALNDLVELLGLDKIPHRIEGYDISHMSGRDVVASMVVFTNGASDRGEYRKFKMHHQRNDDFANMNETITRRLGEKNLKSWGSPDLVLIDGGKGQLDAALTARDERDNSVPFIGLAKKQEQIVVDLRRSHVRINQAKLQQLDGYMTSSETFTLLNLPHSTTIVKLLQRIRDESHRFAVSYHSVLKQKRTISSQLEDIPGVGPVTRKKLVKQFGSVAALRTAELDAIAEVTGKKLATTIYQQLHATLRT